MPRRTVKNVVERQLQDIVNGDLAEEMGKLKAEDIKSNGPRIQGEKPKGFGLKKWRRKR